MNGKHTGILSRQMMYHSEFLTIAHLSVRPEGEHLLEDVNLHVAPGERIAITGHSGGGKTSLLRAVAGLDSAPEGEIRLEGLLPEEHGWPVYRRKALSVAQQPVALAETVESSLARPFLFRHSPGPFPHCEAEELMERFGLGSGTLGKGSDQLSQGEAQRVGLVRALLLKPRVYLLDEPTSALDAETARIAEGLIAEACEAGAAALIVTHDHEQARRWCHRQEDILQWRPYADSR